jgi:tetratricopeptide (TPR) repeat protein
MKEDQQNPSNQEPYYYALWQTHQGRGVLAQNLGRYEEAVVQFSIAAFVVSPDALAMAKMCQAHSLVSLAHVYILMERYERAVPLLQEALTLREDLIPACHPLTAETHHLMANAFRELKQYADADNHYRQSTDCLFTLLPIEDPYVKEVVGNWLVNGASKNAANDLANLNNGGQPA